MSGKHEWIGKRCVHRINADSIVEVFLSDACLVSDFETPIENAILEQHGVCFGRLEMICNL